jgi:hypothetical protein
MTMTARIRKFALTAHVASSVGWLGALAVFFVHSVASLISQDAQMVRAAGLAMGLTAWFVILPLSFASLLTGLVQALGTLWGPVSALLGTGKTSAYYPCYYRVAVEDAANQLPGGRGRRDNIFERRSHRAANLGHGSCRWRHAGVVRGHDTGSVQTAGHDSV